MLARFVDAVVVLVRDVEFDDFQFIDARIRRRARVSMVDLDLDLPISTTSLLLVSFGLAQLGIVPPPAGTSTAPSRTVSTVAVISSASSAPSATISGLSMGTNPPSSATLDTEVERQQKRAEHLRNTPSVAYLLSSIATTSAIFTTPTRGGITPSAAGSTVLAILAAATSAAVAAISLEQ
ncbi:hypothetical protein PG988_012649 [Apiospora saccharicola]